MEKSQSCSRRWQVSFDRDLLAISLDPGGFLMSYQYSLTACNVTAIVIFLQAEEALQKSMQ